MAAETSPNDTTAHVDMSRLTELNQNYFDEYAARCENPESQKAALRLTNELQTHKEWIGVDWVEGKDADGNEVADKSVRVLDYACGPGMVSRAFIPDATEFHGVDISQNMVERYNGWAQENGLYPTKMSAIRGDLTDASGPSESMMAPEYFDFNLAAVGFGLHHFADPTLAAKRLVERLKPGKGVLLILDMLPHGFKRLQDEISAHHQVRQTIAHAGFSEEQITDIFTEAGCVDIKTMDLGEITFGHADTRFTAPVFMARGTRKQ